MKVQADHMHLLAMVPPKVSISDYLGTINGNFLKTQGQRKLAPSGGKAKYPPIGVSKARPCGVRFLLDVRGSWTACYIFPPSETKNILLGVRYAEFEQVSHFRFIKPT